MTRVERIKRGFRNNEEIIIIFSVSVIATFGLYLRIDFIQKVFLEKGLNNLLFAFFGSMFGLLLTSYAMFFGIAPQLDEELRKSENFKKINTKFFISMFFILTMLVISLTLFFYWNKALFTALMFLFIFDILLFLLILTYLFLLFKTLHTEKIS